MENEFDVDVTFEEIENEKVLESMTPEQLRKAVAELPHDLIAPATGILIERRTYSDVSQELGIRQPELVRMVHRSKLLIAEAK
ncbi:MAG: hypothetical protein ACKOXT_00175 [Actinomycetota bacterium]